MPGSLPSAKPLRRFASATQLRQESARRLRLASRYSVSQAAAKFYHVHNPGGGTSGLWSPSDTPYMTEPMDRTQRRGTEALIFAGPAQGGKTAGLLLGGICHTVTCDPADLKCILPTEYRAGRFSTQDIRRMITRSPEVRTKLLPGGDKVYSKHFFGMLLDMGWPAIGHLSGVSIPRMYLTDYDRMDQNIEGEGSPFSLAQKRTQTFGSRGITVAESSPGQPQLGKKPKDAGAHEAPPANGILALYNMGDRCRWQWPCVMCSVYFEGGFAILEWPKGLEPEEAGRLAVMVCPHCGGANEPTHKRAMNAAGVWVGEGQVVDGYGVLTGERRRSSIGSYWLKGTAAAFQPWWQLVARWLRAVEHYRRTGSEAELVTTVNQDQGEPYLSKAQATGAVLEAETLVELAEAYPVATAPAETRFLTAAVDVQKAAFKIMVMAWLPGGESLAIDASTIFKTGEGDDARQISPANRPEDWDILVGQVIQKGYPVQGLEGRLSILLTTIDSGGAAGVTSQAYKFWRRMAKRGLRKRFLLLKGNPPITAPRLTISYPDSQRKDRKAGARGEIPVGLFNANLIKDEVDAGLRALIPVEPEDGEQPEPLAEDRRVPIRLPRAWADDDEKRGLFDEITAEERRDDGKWHKVGPVNDGFDLLCMNRVAAIHVRAERIDWSRPPAWAKAGAGNSLYSATDELAVAAQPAKPQRPGPTQPDQRFARRTL